MEVDDMSESEKRYDLTDEEWALLEPLFPKQGPTGQRGRPIENDLRQVFNGILWILHSGAPWRDLPERYGPWPTVYRWFLRWCEDEFFASMLSSVARPELIDTDLGCIDGTMVRAHKSAAGARKKNRRVERGLPARAGVGA